MKFCPNCESELTGAQCDCGWGMVSSKPVPKDTSLCCVVGCEKIWVVSSATLKFKRFCREHYKDEIDQIWGPNTRKNQKMSHQGEEIVV